MTVGMFRIRFHGRGGQGMKTASRILGTAFFRAGFEVQDAPRYGAERRGAPMFAYVRAARTPINERGVISNPDLVVVADDTLVAVPAAAVLVGVDERTVLLINSIEDSRRWRERLNLRGPVLILPARVEPSEAAEVGYAGAGCCGAAARLVGVISCAVLEAAVREELASSPGALVEANVHYALHAYQQMEALSGSVTPGKVPNAADYIEPDWVELPFEDAPLAAPAIHAALTSEKVPTGLWRTVRPVIDYARCNRCWWVCSTFCPDGAIAVDADGTPRIDYEHCKGCLVCVAQCPPHAIEAVPEHEVRAPTETPS